MLSKKLMCNYNYLLIHQYTRKKNNTYTYLKKSIVIWFDMCKKYNIELWLLYKIFNNNHNQYVQIKARNIIAIKNFNKFLFSPVVIENENNIIENNIASNYLMQII
jgi:hypothetical protein